MDIVSYKLTFHNVEDLDEKSMIVFMEEFKLLDDKSSLTTQLLFLLFSSLIFFS